MRQLGVQTRGASGLPLVTTGGDSLPSLFLSVCDEAAWEGVGPGDGHRSKGGEYDVAMRLTAAITKDGDWFVAQCLEVDVASQGRSIEEARGNLAEALALHFEDQDVEVGEAPIIAPIDVAV